MKSQVASIKYVVIKWVIRIYFKNIINTLDNSKFGPKPGNKYKENTKIDNEVKNVQITLITLFLIQN